MMTTEKKDDEGKRNCINCKKSIKIDGKGSQSLLHPRSLSLSLFPSFWHSFCPFLPSSPTAPDQLCGNFYRNLLLRAKFPKNKFPINVLPQLLVLFLPRVSPPATNISLTYSTYSLPSVTNQLQWCSAKGQRMVTPPRPPLSSHWTSSWKGKNVLRKMKGWPLR